ncbi:hypothetical protein L7F22_000363 [Adiantum nelumboides]|nr:hypothetical protein [Adiantum nelumboides]
MLMPMSRTEIAEQRVRARRVGAKENRKAKGDTRVGVPPQAEERPATKSRSSSWFSRKPVQAEEEEPGRRGEEIQNARVGGRKNIVLGPDGKPCKACNSKLAFTAAMRGAKEPSIITPVLPSSAGDDGERTECPPDGDIIGNSTWTFLHSAAAYYPRQPSEIQQESMLALVRSLVHLYPCHSCAQALGQELAREEDSGQPWQSEARASSGGATTLKEAVKRGPSLRLWLCGIHNEVNERLGKEVWRCDEEALNRRWKDGPADGSCD